MLNYLLFIIILTNSGGEGKTTLTLLLRAILDLAGIDSLAIDADQGNWALKNRSGEDIATDVLAWAPRPGAAAKIVSKATGKSTLMDTGANMMAAGQPIGELVIELQKRFADQGYRTAAFIPVSPNKSGAAEGVNILSDRISDFEKFIVFNHRDKSGNFGSVRDDIAAIIVSHLQPGLQAYLDQHDWRIAEVLTDPATCSTRASAHVGEWVRSFALDRNVRDLLTPLVCDTAIRCLPNGPARIRHAIETLAEASDARIVVFERHAIILDLIDRFGWSAAGLRTAANAVDALDALT